MGTLIQSGRLEAQAEPVGTGLASGQPTPGVRVWRGAGPRNWEGPG